LFLIDYVYVISSVFGFFSDDRIKKLERTVNMDRDALLVELRILQERADTIRNELGISPPEHVTFLAKRETIRDEVVVVEADGFGGATTTIVEGNYPVDYVTKFAKIFRTEEEAETAAERLAYEGASLREVLGAPADSVI